MSGGDGALPNRVGLKVWINRTHYNPASTSLLLGCNGALHGNKGEDNPKSLEQNHYCGL